ncbi:MAG: AAA family ATPase, partial [bacterium]|nr:AAA family ATPase [bacterium]
MYSLFTNDPSAAGYRLEYMEIFNWGTFDKEIFRISPTGNNSLLTGANGSGKTTYVDALLTLLVPIKKHRFYNRSSGTEKKNERTEESYVMGAFGETQEEGKLHSQTLYLRPDKKSVYSILLASFSNADHKPITLFQARWFFNGELKKVYGICRANLTIESDFRPFDPRGEWKKILKRRFPRQGMKDVIEFFDSAKKYGERLVKYFGMRSEKAMSLFNQTVGIKVLGNLDEFIRLNMLEPQEAEEEFLNLKENYQTLLEAHMQIEKADEQARQLRPIRDLAESIAEIQRQLKELETLRETAPVYFNRRLVEFVSTEIERENRSLKALVEKIGEAGSRLKDQEDRRTDLSIAIAADQTGQRIKEIERRLTRDEKDVTARKRRQEKYGKLADVFNLPPLPDETVFPENKENALAMKEKKNSDIETLNERHYQVRKAADEEEKEFAALEKQVRQLRGQKNKITGRVSEIRDEILRFVKAAPDEIPFIGELLKIKDSQKEWEPAIERLLHNFALRFLVPEKYYDAVNRYVNQNNLRGRIVYHRVRDEEFINTMLSKPKDSVMAKLDIKPTVYRDWLENQLLRHYDYICVADVADFHKYKRALTIQGLIKNKDQHQKDDRPEIINKERFVLGWDNKEKILALAQKAKELKKKIDENQKLLKQHLRQLRTLEKSRENLVKLLEYDVYSEIDWQSAVTAIERLTREKKRLEETSDRIKQLRHELQEVEAQIKEQKKDHVQLLRAQALKEDALRRHETIKQQCREEMDDASFPVEGREERFLHFETAYPACTGELNFINFDRTRAQLEREQAGAREKLNTRKSNLQQRLSGKMLAFKNPGSDITDHFHDWRADTYKLSEDTAFVDEYISMLEKIEKEDL